MAAAPIDDSSTPPPDSVPADSTRPPRDSMEDSDPQLTRKRPRLDSGSSPHEDCSTDPTPVSRMPEPTSDAGPPSSPQDTPASTRPASRMTINVKSPVPDLMASVSSEDPPAERPSVEIPEPTPADDTGTHLSNAISVSSSPAQSPEIEVADLEDMGQDPSTSSWQSLGDALGDAEIVQIQEQPSLIDLFPKLQDNLDLRQNVQQISVMIQKGPAHEVTCFVAIKNWLDEVAQNLDQLTYGMLLEDREFWTEVPSLVEGLLHRRQILQPDEGQGHVACLHEFLGSFARLALHILHLDTRLLHQILEGLDLPVGDVLSRPYLAAVAEMIRGPPIPLYDAMDRVLPAWEGSGLAGRLQAQITAPPMSIAKRLSEYATYIMALIPSSPQLSSALLAVLVVVQYLVEPGRTSEPDQEPAVASTEARHTAELVYGLVRAADKWLQTHVTKKSSWVTNEVSDVVAHQLGIAYHKICTCDSDLARRVAQDLSIRLPEGLPSDQIPTIIHHGWRFALLKKHVMDGRMELRVHGVEGIQSDLINIWKSYIQKDPSGVDHPVVQYMVHLLRESKIVEYIVGVDSHPQLISRSGNFVGFLIVTSAYTDMDTDIIWKAVTDSPDPRTVSEIVGMLLKTVHMHPSTSSALIYLCSKLLDLPLSRFDPRMLEFCEQLLGQVREQHSARADHDLLERTHVEAIPLRLCVRLLRESAATTELGLEHKALLQKFASTQLRLFMDTGLSDMDTMETYEQCVQDIAEMNQFSVGSVQALDALIPQFDSQEIRKLATDFDLTRLVIAELAHIIEAEQPDLTDPFARNGLLSRIYLLIRIIDKVPDTITPDLADVLWRGIFMSKMFPPPGRPTLWELLCGTVQHAVKRNPFIDRCVNEYLPELSPAEDYSTEVLAFAKHTVDYEVRFDPPPIAAEGEIVTIPGMDRIWNFILTAPPNSIETDATNFAIQVYLDHPAIRRAPRSAIDATHIALVDRCVDQLRSAASVLKTRSGHLPDDPNGSKLEAADGGGLQTEEVRFSRSLLFLRQFLQGLRGRAQYSPPQTSPPSLPGRPGKGDVISIKYQAFDGPNSSNMRTFQIGELSTAAEVVEALVQVTGFSKFTTIHGGARFNLLDSPDLTVRDLKLDSALLIVRKAPDTQEVAPSGRRPSMTTVDSEVLKHFDDLYELLGLENHLAREIYDFLVVFPPQERVLQLVKSTERTEKDMFPMDKPYNLLYSVNALSICLREAALESSPNSAFVSHSIQVLAAALTRPEMFESLEASSEKLMFATSLVECLLCALLVRPGLADESSSITHPSRLIQQLVHLMQIGQCTSPTQLGEIGIYKLICHSFAVLTEGSVRDATFWAVVKREVQFDSLLRSFLLGERRQSIRKGIADNVAMACRPLILPKKSRKVTPPQDEIANEAASPEIPVRVDILGTIWDAFVKAFPHSLDYAQQSQEFFEVAYMVFQSVAERSPRDLIYSDYLKQWSRVMLQHQTEEFVGREPIDHLVLGFCRLLKSCLDIASSTNIPVDTFDLTESLFDKYLFPDFSEPSSDRIVPQVPVMHNQTRQELYNIIIMLCKFDVNYSKIVGRLEDIIPEDVTYSPGWPFERHKLLRAPEGYAGLRNLSNTCYLNSLLTQLFMNVGFRDFMMQLDLADPASSHMLLDETKKLFGHMQETWLKSVDPQGLVDTIRTYDNEPIDVTIQMDVDEFYNLLFDRWEAQIEDPEQKKKFRSFYGGQLVQQIKSKECSHISERFEPFSAIQCDIKGKANLEESLQAYVEGEIMQGDNKYSCTSCGRHVDAVKRACLKDVPDNLIFHLKRFDFDMIAMMRSKINDEFQFPEHIDMSPFKVEYLSDQSSNPKEDVFELVGVLVHSGTAESGHYYSYIRERPTASASGSWVEFNDSDVSRFDQTKIADQCFGGYGDSVQSATMGQVRFPKVWNAYMLFYQRVSSMENAKSIYKPTTDDYPVRVPLPVPLANHIAMDNEIHIRTYCLLDPFHTLLVRSILSRLHERKNSAGEVDSKLVKPVVCIALDALEQLIARTKDCAGLDMIVSELIRAINDIPDTACRIVQWVVERPSCIRNLLLRSPYPAVRNSVVRIVTCALAKLRTLHNQEEDHSPEKEHWLAQYFDAIESVTMTLEGLWISIQTANKAWDDYFEFLWQLAGLGPHEAGIVLNYGFLQKCLEIMWLDRDDLKRLRRHYHAYIKFAEKGRRFSHRKLMDLLSRLLANVDLTMLPTPDDERQISPDGRFTLTLTEGTLMRTLGKNREMLVLKKILQEYSSPQACREIVGLLLDAEPGASLMEPICKVLEDGLRVAPAELCTPFLDATLVFCRRSPDEDRIASLIDYVSKGIETINHSGGKEHVAFLGRVKACHNERLGLDGDWFLSQLTDRVPDWAPTLLIFPDRMVRTSTVELLRDILFSGESQDESSDWKARHARVAKELVHASIDKLTKTYLTISGSNIETKVVETIKPVISHCLATYFDDNDEEREFTLQARAVLDAVEELAVDLPEELASESDITSPEEWEDNSAMASDSEIGGLAGSP